MWLAAWDVYGEWYAIFINACNMEKKNWRIFLSNLDNILFFYCSWSMIPLKIGFLKFTPLLISLSLLSSRIQSQSIMVMAHHSHFMSRWNRAKYGQVEGEDSQTCINDTQIAFCFKWRRDEKMPLHSVKTLDKSQ